MSISSDLELLTARAVGRSRLLERAVHDRGPWIVMAYGSRVVQAELTCEVLPRENRVVLTGYLGGASEGIDRAVVYCRGRMVTCVALPGLATSPCRFTLEVGVIAGELAA